MNRLTEKQSAGYDLKALNGQYCNNYCDEQSAATCRDCAIYQAIQKLAHYENMEEDGKLLKLPCKPWDTVYVISKYTKYDIQIIEAKVTQMKIKDDGKTVSFSCRGKWKNGNPYIGNFVNKSIGKTVFLTKPEAQVALEEMKK